MSPRYRNPSYLAEIDDEASDEEHVLQEELQETPASPEEATFKKRYGDLRRHEQEQRVQYENRIKALETQVAEATKAQIKYPKTKEELEAWVEKYPDVAGMIKTLIGMESETKSQEVVQTKEELNKLKKELERERVLAALVKVHPDFPDIWNDHDFHAWVDTKSQAIKDTMYSDNYDLAAAIDVIDLWKAYLGKTKKTVETASDPRAKFGAATSVRAPSSSAPAGDNKATWSESKVEALSDREYAKYEAEIDEARASGKFVYDLSGAAR